jgi:hypothetical protein
MSTTNSLDLYSLLPAIYRIRDAERGYPLRGFLGLISGQAQLVKANLDGLWDDLFIETCADWVIPYIGDLVANNPISEDIARTRADVANTIYYRRRKGTLIMLEQLARDVTGWDAHAVAFFEQLGWSQNMNHLRFHVDVSTDATDPFAVDRVGTVLLRDLDSLDRLSGAFDSITHTVDVRPPCQLTGWYNINKIGFFLWRLESFFMQEVTPGKSSWYADGFYFSPLGNPAPLFTNPAPAPTDSLLVNETQVQTPIRKVAFYFKPENYYLNDAIPSPSMAIYHGAKALPANLIPLASVVCGDLSNWTPPASGKVAIDVALGRIAFAPGETPHDGVTVSYTYGFSGQMGSGPYERRAALSAKGDPGPVIPNSVADPASGGTVIRVPSTGINTLSQAISAWNPAVNPHAVIQIEDNRTYREDITIAFPGVAILPGGPSPVLVIQADDQQRPTLIGNITMTGGTGAEEAVLNGLLITGRLHVQGNLRLVEVVHTTLVPGQGLDEQGQPSQPDLPSVLIDAPADKLQLVLDHSISGALRLPEGMTGLFVRDSIIDSPRRSAQADFSPVLVSGSLSSFPALSSSAPRMKVTIGDEGPYIVTLSRPPAPVPATLADARDALQRAIRAAHYTLPFTATRVLSASNRLIVVPGGDEEIVIEVAGRDATASDLRLDPSSSRQTSAVISGPLSPFPAISATAQVNVSSGMEGPKIATFASTPASVAQARHQLQLAIRAAGTGAGFTGALVTNMDDQLVVVSGDSAGPITFGSSAIDSTTLIQLKLATERPAIAADDGGDIPGPPATLIRATIFGRVHVQQLLLASEVIFTSPALSRQKQDGCVRFSYVPEGSETPKRYRCQPDFEIAQRIEEAERAAGGAPISDADRDAIRDGVRGWLQPSFTDVHYSLPGYCQLLASCPQQIQTGAEDGSEMGVFCFLKQPQRVTSLRVRLQEYLPFGLEPGMIYVT